MKPLAALPIPAMLDEAVDIFCLDTRLFGVVDPDNPDPLRWTDDGDDISPEIQAAEPALPHRIGTAGAGVNESEIDRARRLPRRGPDEICTDPRCVLSPDHSGECVFDEWEEA